MCTIDKMLIKGVRSFSPDNVAVIEFYKPLTLIVGHNGAGKTTIIECLKMACTGETPPNTRQGQAFVYDPKVARETEVKAQIKLRFYTALEQPVVIMRSFQLVQKKTATSFSSIDQLVQTHNRETGKKESLSYRCADMDRIVPQLMGVSKAILENVIFVHQEDSNWPLLEAAVLKRKFDDIFAATKYTKAVECLNKIRKEKAQDCKEFRLKLEHLATHKEAAHKLKLEVDKGARREQALAAQIAGLEEQLQGHTKELADLNDRIQAWQDRHEALAGVRTRLEVVLQQNAEAHVRLVAGYGEDGLDASLEELRAWERELEPRIAETASRLDGLRLEAKAAETRSEALKQQHAAAVRNEAGLAAEASAHALNVSQRDQALRAASSQAGVGQLHSGPLSEEAVKTFVAALGSRLTKSHSELQELRRRGQQVDDEASRAVDDVTARITDAAERARIKAEGCTDSEDKIVRLQHESEASPVGRSMVEDAEAGERAAEARLKAKQDALAGEDFGAALSTLADELGGLQRKATALRQERDQLAVAAEDGARLQLLRRERLQKQAQLDTLLGNRRQALSRVLETTIDRVPAARQLKAAVDTAAARLQAQLGQREGELRRVQAQASSTQGALAATAEKLGQQRQEADALRASLDASLAQIQSQATTSESLDASVAACQKQHDKQRGTLERVKALEINYGQFISTAEKENICNVCRRPFASGELAEFIDNQRLQASLVPRKKDELSVAIQQTETRLRGLRALQPDWVRLERLRSSVIAATSREHEALEAKAAVETEQAEQLHVEHRALQQRLQEIQQLQREAVWPIDRLATEVEGLAGEAARAEDRLRIAGGARTVGDVDADLETLEAARAQLERRRDDLQRRQGRLRDEITHLQTSWHSAREEAMSVRAAAEKRASLEREIADLQGACVQLRQQAEAAAQSAAPLRARRDELTRDRQQRREAARQREAEAEAGMRELQTVQAQVAERVRSVEVYDATGKAGRLRDVRDGLERIAGQLQEQEAKLKGVAEEIREGERELLLSDQNKCQILALISYKQGVQTEEELRAELDKAQAEVGSAGDMADLNSRFETLQQRCTELRKQQNMAEGSLATVREGVARATADLGDVNYRNIDQRHYKQFVELKTTEMAVSDVEKYTKALEKALLMFHTEKMGEINKTIKELWQRTYRNQDIDYIEICADTGTGKGTRSYNYRVAMHVGGAELEMRGRCSAGQKVLACLIIRMALAETFCLNCGILALDEPTTNLDADNSRSLAEALRAIMESRRAQSNFQLIVITHDESFARLIGDREHAEFMWRVSKDSSQQSRIEKEPLG